MINKQLTYDILLQTRQPGILCFNNAKSCFDRVVHSVEMLAYRKMGILEPPVQGMIKTLQNMKHRICTRHDNSTFTVSADISLKLYQGLLQGNGAFPAIWVIKSGSLMELMRKAHNCSFFVEPIKNIVHHVVGYAFVDNTDVIILVPISIMHVS